ncbi:MAG: hypothetical protein H6907_18100 [Hyphomicrobiales bacterium]|nr:hypothetical protein [Hyphomicrobiales bacterium]MCP5373647.1 hypothetical protein [Hyphomicrobiales bacterium]
MSEPAAAPPPLTEDEVDQTYRAFFAGDDPLACTREQAAAFVADLADHLPPAEGAGLAGNFARFLDGNPDDDTAWRSLRPLARIARARGLQAVVARHDGRVVEQDLEPFAARINGGGPGGRTVVFLAHQPYFLIMREAMYLRRNGHRAFLVSHEPLSPNLRPLFAGAFDGVIDARRSYPLLRRLLQMLRPDVFHVQCWMWSLFLGRLALDLRGGAAVVCEFYDVTSIYAPRDVLCRHWPREMVDLDLAMEGHILRHADAVVGRFPEDIAGRWMDRLGAAPPYLRMLPYACAEFTDYGTGKLSAADGVTRLVYAGSLIVDPSYLYPEAGTAAGFERLLAQGLAIDVLHNPHQPVRREDPAYADFFALMDRYPRFRILDGVPPDRLSAALAPYDFGIHLFEYDLDTVLTNPDQRRGVVATKLFAYFEAGLPVLMNAEYEEMARILEDGGFGLGIATADLDRVAERIAAFDYAAAVAAIRAFNRDHGMDREIHRLIALYDRITGAR